MITKNIKYGDKSIDITIYESEHVSTHISDSSMFYEIAFLQYIQNNYLKQMLANHLQNNWLFKLL